MTWYDVLSYILNIGLLIWGVIQMVTAKKEEENTQSELRNWHNQAEGIKNALLQIGQNPSQYSDKVDISNAVSAVSQSAVAFSKALEQRRLFTEEEVKKEIQDGRTETKRMLNQFKKQRQPTAPVTV